MCVFLRGNSENEPAEDFTASGLPPPGGNSFFKTGWQMDALPDHGAGRLSCEEGVWRCPQLASNRRCDGARTGTTRGNLLRHSHSGQTASGPAAHCLHRNFKTFVEPFRTTCLSREVA